MTTPNFKNMWPTQLMEINLPGHDQANPVLAEYLEKIDVERAQMTTNYLSENLFDKPHPILQWLKQSIERAVVDYSQALTSRFRAGAMLTGWVIIIIFTTTHALGSVEPTMQPFQSRTPYLPEEMTEHQTASASLILGLRPI